MINELVELLRCPGQDQVDGRDEGVGVGTRDLGGSNRLTAGFPTAHYVPSTKFPTLKR